MSKGPVSIAWQTIMCILPLIWIFAFLRIEKLMMGLVLVVVAIVGSIGMQMIFPYPWGLFFAWIFTIILPAYYIRKWSREWNSKITS